MEELYRLKLIRNSSGIYRAKYYNGSYLLLFGKIK